MICSRYQKDMPIKLVVSSRIDTVSKDQCQGHHKLLFTKSLLVRAQNLNHIYTRLLAISSPFKIWGLRRVATQPTQQLSKSTIITTLSTTVLKSRSTIIASNNRINKIDIISNLGLYLKVLIHQAL